MSPGRRRSALIAVWVALGLLVGVIVALEYRDHLHAGAGGPATDARALLPVPVSQLGAVEIADAGRLHRFERDAAGTWFYHGVHTATEGVHAHPADPALAERIERALAAFGRTRMERDFALGRDGDAYGVTTPEILVLVYRPKDQQPLAQYAVGHVAPDTLSRYVMVVGKPVVVTIPKYQIDNLLALVQSAAEPSTPAAVSRP